jgi:hypothetical protein
LHEQLCAKNGPAFWKTWRSKFENANICDQVDGSVDNATIVNKFVKHFSAIYACNSTERAAELKSNYTNLRQNYCGLPLTDDYLFNTELVCSILVKLKCGKAAGLDKLSAEHLLYSHPSLPCILYKLFNLILFCRHIPSGFGLSYTVPVPKVSDCRTKAMTTDDFRGIAISPIISKVFEHCVLDRFSSFFASADNQFGFKKGLSCSHAVFSARNIVDRFVNGGSTMNLCSIDLSKAFDKVNLHALFIKLMKRHIPVELLETLEQWLNNCWTCVKWKDIFSHFLKINFGVRQGSVLSPHLFAIYLDGIVDRLSFKHNFFVILYADDILLLAPSLCELQRLLFICESELNWLDMLINVKKSSCMRIGPRHDIKCDNIVTTSGHALSWVDEIHYLGIFFVRGVSSAPWITQNVNFTDP